jgi:type I restriction enzyme R subunit
MRTALAKHNADLVAQDDRYVMQITGDNEIGKRELDNFINPEERYPVITTTSELMTTGVDAQTCKVIVLDCIINSPTKFKQIIGRGTRINEEFGKLYFTILDFRNATDRFADKDFDGDPVRIKPATDETDLGTIISDEEKDETSETDIVDGTPIDFTKPEIRYPQPEDETTVNEPGRKVVVNGVDVSVLVSRELYFDKNGKPVTVSLKDYTKEVIKDRYSSLNDFLTKWNSGEKKDAIIKELEEQGLLVQDLLKVVNREVDLFDLIAHIAYDQPPLTRIERANNVRKRNYFGKYSDKAKRVLEALLDKYADEGVTNIENIEVLRVKPLDELGSPYEIISEFGGKEKYISAVQELEQELYRSA